MRSAFSPTGTLLGGMFAAAMLFAGPAAAAPVCPDARSNLVAQGNFTGSILSTNTITGASFIDQGQNGSAASSGAASTLGFFKPIISGTNFPGLGAASAGAGVTVTPSPLGGQFTAAIGGSAQAALDFFLCIDGLAGPRQMLVGVNANTTENHSGPSVASTSWRADVDMFNFVTNVGGFSERWGTGLPGSPPFGVVHTVDVQNGDIFLVKLFTQASVFMGGNTAQLASSHSLEVLVDPSFEIIGLTAADNAQLFASANLAPLLAPEPGTLAILALGLAGLGVARRRRIG